MNSQEFLAALEKALVLDSGSLSMSQVLDDLESWDSMSVLELQAIADEEFGLELEPKAIGNCKTIGDLWGLLSPGDSA